MERFPSFEASSQEQSGADLSAVLRVTQTPDGRGLSIQQMTSRLERLPEDERKAVIHDTRFIDAVVDRATEPGKPLIPRLERVPEEIRETIIQHPRIIEAVIQRITEPGKPAKSRLEHLPEDIARIVENDPRIQKISR